MKGNDNRKSVKNNLSFLFVCSGIILILLAVNIIVEKNQDVSVFGVLSDDFLSPNGLVINEILTDNEGVNIDENGNLYDWIELYNGTNRDIDLTNYGLSDKQSGEVRWLFPKSVIKSKSYLLIYLGSNNSEGLYANFSLKKEGGELLTLKSSYGKVVDVVNTIEMQKNTSMFRDNDGSWKLTTDVTPGFENSTKGREDFLYSFSKSDNNTLLISEVLPSNEGNVSFDGYLYDYVEVTNYGDTAINLGDYYFSNDESIIYKWHFPDKQLEPDTSYLVYMNGLDVDNNASFSLKNKNGKLYLSNKNGIVDRLEYTDLTNGVAYIKTNNEWYQSANISPGFPNNSVGKINYQEQYDKNINDLVINEVMSSNKKYLAQNGNQYYDWIELYNNSEHDIQLSEYTITTNKDEKNMYTLPKVNLKKGAYYILMASGNTSLSNSSYKHTNFKLSSGNGLLLYKEEILIDSLYIYGIPRGSSYGRGKEHGHYFYSKPTPKANNGKNGVREVSYNPTFDVESGIYNNVESLKITLSGSGDIYYTLDGSTPSNKSTKYKDPIVLTKTTVIKAISYEKDRKSSEVITKSYIINENHTLPVVSISLNNTDLSSLFYNPFADSIAAANVELYEKNSSFSISCGMKIFGGDSRNLSKKSFVLKIGKDYSTERLNYKLFDNKELLEFSDIVLRSGSQDQTSSMIRDEFVSTMIVNYGTIVAQAAKPVVLYINGNYYGIYFIREKIDENYIKNNFNVEGTTNIVDSQLNAESGSNRAFIDLKKYMLNNDMSLDTNYEYVSKLIDIESFIDYYVVEFIVNNTDTHNIRFFNNSKLDGGKIKVLLYDSDYTLRFNSGASYIDFLINPTSLIYPPDVTYIRELMKNEQFRKQFVERVAYYIKNVWTEKNITKTFNYFYKALEPEMKRNGKKWGYDYNTWISNVNNLKSIALQRINTVPYATKEYFNLSQEEYNEYFNR